MLSTRTHTRLRHIHREIERQRYPSGERLAKELGVGKKTIQRLVKDLKDYYGAEIGHDAERQGYYYKQAPTNLVTALGGVQIDEKDRVPLALGAKALEFVELKDEAKSLRRWIRSISGESLEIPLQELDRIISFQDQGKSLVLHKDLRTLLEAIIRHQSVRFNYRTAYTGEFRERKVDPYHLSYRDGSWYLIGYSHERKGTRVFNLVRCGSIERLRKESFSDPGFDPQSYFLDAGIIQNGKAEAVHWSFHPDVVPRVEERNYHYNYIRKPYLDDDGYLHLEFLHPMVESLVSTVLSFGPDIEVHAPDSLRQQVREKLAQAAKLYG